MYYYRVYAYNLCGSSAYSNVASAVTLLPPPANPATNMTSSSFTANWGSGSTGTTGYLLDVATDSGFSNYVSGYRNLDVGNVQNRNVSGVSAGTYYYRLQSYSLVGASADSNVVSATTVTSTPTPTPAPTPSSSPWSKGFGSTANDAGEAVAFDSSGNMYATGYFQGTVNFGDNCSMLTSAGYEDVFVVKYSAGGTCQWSKDVGSSGNDFGYGIAVDSNDNVIVAGTIGGLANFGGQTADLIQPGFNIFAAKYAPDGTYQWARTFGSPSGGNNKAYAVAVDSSGNVALTGLFQNTIDFGGGPMTSLTGYPSGYVLKLSSTGGYLWSKGFLNSHAWNDAGRGIAFDPNGNVVVTGNFSNTNLPTTVDFGCGATAGAGGSEDMFLVKYSASGVCQWSNRYGDVNDQYGKGVAVDSTGNIIVTGQYRGTMDFGGGPLPTNLTPYPYLFVAELTSAGNQVWAKPVSATTSNVGNGVAVDPSGTVAVTGYFIGTADFGGGPLTSAGLTVFVAKYSASGGYVWARAFAGTASNQGYGVAADRSGNVGATGYFQGSVNFGQGSFTSAGGLDGFMLKLGP
jgi:hypothetical protein